MAAASSLKSFQCAVHKLTDRLVFEAASKLSGVPFELEKFKITYPFQNDEREYSVDQLSVDDHVRSLAENDSQFLRKIRLQFSGPIPIVIQRNEYKPKSSGDQ